MNPPFKDAEKHFMKAIDFIEYTGHGDIIGLCSTETVTGGWECCKPLMNKLDKYKAKVHFLDKPFTDAEVKTNVEVALIEIHI